jgi:hypothetical protein
VRDAGLEPDFVKVDRSIIAGALDDLNVQAVLVAHTARGRS